MGLMQTGSGDGRFTGGFGLRKWPKNKGGGDLSCSGRDRGRKSP